MFSFKLFVFWAIFFSLSCSSEAVGDQEPISFSRNFIEEYYRVKDLKDFRSLLHPSVVSMLDSESVQAKTLERIESDILIHWDVKSIQYYKDYEKNGIHYVEFKISGLDRGKVFSQKTIVSLKKHEDEWKVFSLR